MNTNKWLSAEFWSGKRWITVDGLSGQVIADISTCYQNYADADSRCKDLKVSGCLVKIRVLSSVLKEINGYDSRALGTREKQVLQAAAEQYPIFIPHSATKGYQELFNSNFYPVLWEKKVHPLAAVRRYVILQYNRNDVKGFHLLKDCENFHSAIDHFMAFRRAKLTDLDCLMLVGEMDTDVEYSYSDIGDGRSVLPFYKMEWHQPDPGDDTGGTIIQMNDPSTPIIQMIAMFARYDPAKQQLTFYDETLRRIKRGDESIEINLASFAF
jgi:hypothetical protein